MSVKLLKFDKNSGENASSEEITVVPPAVLGRGSLLKCGEKKISRKHAVLDWDENGVVITSTHLCSTYISVNEKDSTLAEGECATLLDGDSFGFLPQSFWYKVILPSSKREVDEDVNHTNGDALSRPPANAPTECTSLKATEEVKKEEDEEPTNTVCNEEKPEAPCQINTHKIKENSSIQLTEAKTSNILNDNLEAKKVPVEPVQAYASSRQRDVPAWLTSPSLSKLPNKAHPAKKGTNENEGPASYSHGKKQPKAAAAKRRLPDNSNTPNSTDKKAKITKLPKRGSPKKASRAKQYHCMSLETEDPDPDAPCDPPGAHDMSDKEEEEKSPEKATPSTVLADKVKDLGTSLVQQTLTSDGKITKLPKGGSPKKASRAKQYHCMSLETEDPEPDAPCDPPGAHDMSDEEEEEKSPKKTTPTPNLAANYKDSAASSVQQTVNSHGKASKNPPPATNRQDDLPNVSLPPKNTKVNRSSCPYGANCYRRNPQHRNDTAHPGDSDYASDPNESNSDDDDRPECEYGITCYRKNPQHKAAYKHTRKPQPPRNTKRKAKRRKGGDEDDDNSENEYDYDDPFLNDNSSDDYAPTDSGSDSPWSEGEEEHETKRMLKEAKKFVKKKKG